MVKEDYTESADTECYPFRHIAEAPSGEEEAGRIIKDRIVEAKAVSAAVKYDETTGGRYVLHVFCIHVLEQWTGGVEEKI